ncbi:MULTISPECIES: TIGR03745 family integrating conjugative element membrane protein [unclassified Pseudomonas]|jgi:integrating conjugative element membrane protein (TIGR03745 family)|uniref:TIGR03745 family integrating conjugative element membrane protein n=1 Tax=unclassified Pseudomonas TaxID=196821 RepID=UPI0007621B38|nr:MULTISPECIES: TIGR03745 family integrating conjugative element membrane protein [unclassified Pseudomonas]KYC16499.1 conjugal transfer protein [Pseudomonas sp. ABFPK]
MSLKTNFKPAACVATAAIASLPGLAAAALPGAQAPTRGEGTSWLQTLQNYGYDGFMLLGLILLGGMMVGVASHAFGVYHEIHEGKKKWRDLGLTAVVGVCLVGIGVFMVTKATGVL